MILNYRKTLIKLKFYWNLIYGAYLVKETTHRIDFIVLFSTRYFGSPGCNCVSSVGGGPLNLNADPGAWPVQKLKQIWWKI